MQAHQLPQPPFAAGELEELALRYNVDREELQHAFAQDALQGIQHGDLEQPLNFGQEGFP